jgi:uncharacterized protein YjiS (DUF1127 family)
MHPTSQHPSPNEPMAVAPSALPTQRDAAIAVTPPRTAGNDPDYDAPTQAPERNGSVAAAETADVSEADAWTGIAQTYRTARAARARLLATWAAAGMRATAAFLRHARLRYRQWREARAARNALSELDDRALHDLGLDRSEVASIAAEVSGAAERTRMRAMLA